MFGHRCPKKGFPYNKNKNKIIELIKIKNTCLHQLKETTSLNEKQGLQALLDQTRIELRGLRRTENRQRKRWLKKQQRRAFNNNPYQCGKDLLSPRSKIKPSFEKSRFDKFLREQFADPKRNKCLELLDGLPNKPNVKYKFNGSKFKRKDYNKLISSRRNGSAPGLNKIPYKVYKKCPLLADFLFEIILTIQRTGNVPIHWRVVSSIFFPKTEDADPNNFGDFREISLLNVEGKIFLTWCQIAFCSML